MSYPQLGSLAIVASGYADTILLLVAVIYLFRWLRRGGRRRRSLPDEPMESEE
jgi:hypothetical protein